MKSSSDLRSMLKNIDRKGYPAYKGTYGIYDFGNYYLSIDHVQGDPFASPSKLSIEVKGKKAGFPAEFYNAKYKRIALCDHLTRLFYNALSKISFRAKGSGKSGLFSISKCGQEVLERTACTINPSNGDISIHFEAGFPANGRTVNGRELSKMLFDLLPSCAISSLFYKNIDQKALKSAIDLSEDQYNIRTKLDSMGLVAFIADGSILPRESGVSQRPMKHCVAFKSPDSYRVSFDLPHHGKITGMGIPKGITLIVGGGYHGKSTLLKALELGVYDHIKGDGREFVITDPTAMKIRAEDGRSITNTDISMFINNLPNGKDTISFCTEDASGSTSQAAGVLEGMEAETSCFLIDEDTSATNFLVRDAFMQRVVSGDQEPITPFIARVRDLYEKVGISTILVAGSSGAFFHVADTIIQMDAYRPKNVKMSVEALLPEYPPADLCSNAEPFTLPTEKRMFVMERKIKRHGRGEREERIKTKVMGTDGFSIEHNIVDLRCVEQLIDAEQTAALAAILKHIVKKGSICMEMQELVAEINTLLKKKGMAAFVEGALSCGYAYPRKEEIYLMLNRFRRG